MGSFRIGRIAGIDILIHWSWFAVCVLLVYWLAEGFYGEVDRYNHWETWERWMASVITVFLFFGSVLVHELSHSLVAKRLGLPVANITLFIFGGVSSLTEEPRSAKEEFQVAIVGPLTSFAIGIGCGMAAFVMYLNDLDNTVVGAILEYLTFINIAVGVFNMLPGYPLDGGRVFRAALWARSKNIMRATRWASRAGSAIAFGLMALGAISALAGNVVGGVWFIIIGWFLRNTSEQAYQQLVYRNSLEGATVQEMVNSAFEPASPDATLSQLVSDYMIGRNQRCVPIVVAGDLLGVVTMSDLRKIPQEEWPVTSAFRAMTPREQLHVITPQDQLSLALELMAQHEVHQLPVVDQQRSFLGFVTRADVLRLIQIKTDIAASPVV